MRQSTSLIMANRRRSGTPWLRLAAVFAGLVALIAPLTAPMSASAAGNGVLTITMEPVDVVTGSPQTWAGMTGFATSTRLGYRISYSCSVEDCVGATIQVSPGPTDPTYNSYRHLLYQDWTAPFPGATISGSDTTGRLVTLGDLAAGASGSFTMNYQWSMSGNANSTTIQPAQFFPNGFPIVMSATGQSSSIANTPTATAAPVEWRSEIRDPALSQEATATVDSGANVTYTVRMNSGCLPIRESAPKGDSRYTCAESFVVTDHLDPRATFVSAALGGVYNSADHTVTWTTDAAPGVTYPAPAPGWYYPGNSTQWIPRTVTVRYDQNAFSPSGTDTDYCDFTASVTNRVTMRMVFLSVAGTPDQDKVRTLEATRSHNVVCVRPFSKAVFDSKVSSFDGPNRYGNGTSPIVVQPDASPNVHRWDISVSNQANVPGVAVIAEPNLAIEGTRPKQIQATNGSGVQQNDATITWELNDGTTGTSMGVANAPAGTWFVEMTVTSGPLAGPNLLATGTLKTVFLARVSYEVAGNAPIGSTRTNTATAKMTYPGYPSLTDIDLGSRTHTLQYLEPFGRGVATKDTTGATAGTIPIPATGSQQQFWSVFARNTGNVPGVAVIEDNNLGAAGMKVTSLLQVVSSNNTTAGATVQYTLNTGATGAVPMPFSAPSGTWFTAVKVTTSVLEPLNALSTQNQLGSAYELRLVYQVPSTTAPGTTWTNTANVTMTYPGMGVANVAIGDVARTVTYGAAAASKPSINAGFVGAGIVEGGGQAVPGRNVTFTVRGSSLNVPTGDTFSPQYVFIAPANWSVTPGSAAFAANTVPAGVIFTYKTVTIGGVARQAVVATWPAGVNFGVNEQWPSMTVIAQPTALAVAGSSAIATAWAGEASHNWTTTEATFGGAVTDTFDIDADGATTEGFATANAAALTVGSASQLTVIKEICFPDPDAADGCEWVAQPGAVVGVDPAATNIEYRVRLVNTGNTSLTNLVAYDVLPHVGDMGTSAAASSTPRNSTFQEELNEIVSSTGVSLAYSTSTNPCRAEVYPGAPGCVNNWNTAGSAASGAQSLRITASAAVAPGGEVSVRYKAAVVPGAAADAIACNSVAAKATQIGVPAEPLAVCATTQEADLEIEVPARLPLQIDRPGVIPYTVTNNGGSLTAPAIVDVEIPAGMTVTGLTPAGWTCTPSQTGLVGPLTLSCSPVDTAGAPRTLDKDVPDTLSIPVIPTAGADVCVDAAVHGRMSDPDLANNDASACFTIATIDPAIALTKDDSRTVVSRGDEYTYTLTVTNRLVGEAVTGVVLTDTLPAGLEFVSASDGGTEANGVVTWPGVDLAAAGSATAGGNGTTGALGASATRTVTVRVSDTAVGSIVNEALASAADPADSTKTLSDEASDTDELLLYTVTKSVNAPAEGVLVGDELTYTVVVSNNGTAPFPGVLIRDDLSEILDDATFVAGSASLTRTGQAAIPVADPAATQISWTGTLAPNSSATLTYRVAVGAGGDAALTNVAYTSGSGVSCDATTGVDNTGAPCATTQTYFAPLVAKQVQSLAQNDDGTWTITYGLSVVNRNPSAAVGYTLADDLAFGAGIDVVQASVTSAPGATLATWDGAGNVTAVVSLPAGATHEYVIEVVANAKDLAGTPAAQCVDGTAGGFANTASIALASGRTVTTATCAEPVEPSVSKSVATPTQNADGSWSVVYTITATAPADAPAAGLAYSLDDSLSFPSGVVVTNVAVTGPGGASINPAFNGDSDTSVLTSVDRVAAGQSRVFTVTVTTEVAPGSVTGSALACAPAGSGGYANTVSLLSGSSTTEIDSADACATIIAAPTPTVVKSVTSSAVGGTGDWTIVYDVTVTNPSAQYSTEYSLDDELQFGDGITVVSAAATSTDATVRPEWNGASDVTIVQDVALPSAAVHHYTVTVVATPPTVIDDTNSIAMDCRVDAGETGTGFRNLATVRAGVLAPFSAACEPATDPSVVKTTVGAPTQNPTTGLWGIQYQITVTNRSTSTVAGGIPYSLEDTLGFPSDVAVSSVTVAGPGTTNPSFDGVADTTLASGSIGAAASDTVPETHVYTVNVVFRAPGGLAPAERLCDPAQGTGGLRNEVEITVGGRTTADVACADVPESPVFGVVKSVLSQTQQADGTWVVLYRVTVANPSGTVAGFYDLDDEFTFGDGIQRTAQSVVAAPAGVTVNHAGFNGSTDTMISQNVLLAGGGSHQYTVRAVIDSGSVRATDAAGDCTVASGETGTGFRNSVTVASGAASRDAAVCVTAFDPSVAKTVNGAPVLNAEGSWTVRYVVTVTNPSATVGLTYGLTDELDFPAGTTFTGHTVTARSGAAPASLSWNGVADTTVVAQGATLAAGVSHVFDVTIVATLPADQESIEDGWANSATVLSSTGGVVTTTTEATADIELPELEISKTSDATGVLSIGDVVTYTVTATNVGVGAFTSTYPAEAWDDLTGVLDDATLTGAPTVTPAGGSLSTAGDRIHFSGALGAGASVRIVYSVAVTALGDQSLANVAFVGSPGTTPATPGECLDDVCASTETALPGFLLEKSASTGVATQGDTVEYELTFTNTSTVDVTGATFSDELAAVLDDATLEGDIVASVGDVELDGTDLTWTGDLAAGASVTVTYSVVVGGPLTGDGVMTNTATSDPDFGMRWPDGECPDVDDATCDAPQRTVKAETGIRALAFTKVADATRAVVGQKVTYTVTVTNIGSSDYTPQSPAVIVDSMAGLLDDARYNSDAITAVGATSYTAPNLQWTGPIEAGETITFRYSVTINPAVTGDRKLSNVIGLSATSGATFDACLAAPTDNAQEHCIVAINIAPLAATGASSPYMASLIALLTLLVGAVLVIVTVRRRRENELRP